MAFEQIRIFLGLDTSSVGKGLAKARAEIKAQSGKIEKGAGNVGLGGIVEAIKSPLGAATAAIAAIGAGLKFAGERAQALRDISIETGTALDTNTRIVASLGDAWTNAADSLKEYTAWYSKLFAMGLFLDKFKNRAQITAGQKEDFANTTRLRAIQDAELEAKNASLLVDNKINAKAIELGKLRSRQLDDAEALKAIDTSTDAGAALAGKLQLQINARNLEIIQKQGALDAEKLARSREIAASEIALQQSITAGNTINATHAYKMSVLEKEAVALEQQKAKYAGDIAKQNDLQAQANAKRNEAAKAEKDFKLAMVELNQKIATQTVSVLLNNDRQRVTLLMEQADEEEKIAAMLFDEIEKTTRLANAQAKRNEALQISRSLHARILELQASTLRVTNDFKNVVTNILGTDIQRAKILREQAEQARRLAEQEKDKEVRAQKLVAAQEQMNKAVEAELRTRTQISGISDIAELGGRTERGRMARKAQQLYNEAKTLEAKGQYGEADNRRRRAQELEERVLARDRSRLQSGVNKKDLTSGRSATDILASMKTDLQKIEGHLQPKKLK